MSPRAAPAARPGSPTASGRYMLALGPPPPRSPRRRPARSLRPGRAPPALPDLGSRPIAETPPLMPRPQPRRSHTSAQRQLGPMRALPCRPREGFPECPRRDPGSLRTPPRLLRAEGAHLPTLQSFPSPLKGRPNTPPALPSPSGPRGSGSNFSILPPSLGRPTSQPASRSGRRASSPWEGTEPVSNPASGRAATWHFSLFTLSYKETLF